MPAQNYTVWSKVPQRRNLDDPDSVQYNVGLMALAKRSASSRFEVANEYLALRLGQALNLPIPPGVPLMLYGEEYFASLNFAASGEALPPVDIQSLVRRHPRLACGIVVFDCWICNEDRHDENLSWIAYDVPDDDHIQIFDHGRSLLSAGGLERLLSYEDKLPTTELAAYLESLASFDAWDDRLRRIPGVHIADLVTECGRLYGLTTADSARLAEFLDKRRFKLRRLFAAEQTHRSVFQSLQPQLWKIRDDSHDEGNADDLEYRI